jgi:hypothetical protein
MLHDKPWLKNEDRVINLALSFYCPTFEKDKGVANVVCSDAYSYIDTQGEFLYGFSSAKQAFITSPYSLSLRRKPL